MNQDTVLDILDYDEITGIFVWKKLNKYSPIKKGSIAGSSKSSNGYINIKINGKMYLAHRLAWLYMTGNYPDKIDHSDHNGLNNIFSNLRDVSHGENMKNKSKRKGKKYPNGVGYHSRDKRFQAYVTIDGKQKHLGYFDTENEAELCRKTADIKYGFHKNHGK